MNINPCKKLTGAKTVKEAMTRCEPYAERCPGVYQSHYEPKLTNGPPKKGYVMLCQGKSVKLLTGSRQSVLYTSAWHQDARIHTRGMCSMPKNESQGQKLPHTHLTSLKTFSFVCVFDIGRITDICGLPDQGKTFKPGKRLTSACKKKCATECFEGWLVSPKRCDRCRTSPYTGVHNRTHSIGTTC